MANESISSEKLTIYFEKTASEDWPNEAKLFRYLEEAVRCCESFLFTPTKLWPGISSQCQQIETQLVLCSSEQMRELNLEQRGIDRPTDVLSFPVFENLRSGGEEESEIPVLSLGDIFICRERALEQAQEFQISCEEEALHLFIHGFLHLCGFDHEVSEREQNVMEELEIMLLKNISMQIKEGDK